MANEPAESSAVTSADAAALPAKRKSRFWRRFWIVVLLSPVVLPLLTYGCVRVTHPRAGARNIRVSRETTFLVEPLAADGSVDYIEGLNAQYSQGVTRANNAAVLFWETGAPERVNDEQFLSAVAKELQVDPRREREYQGLYAFVAERPELRSNHPRASEEFYDAPLGEAMPAIYAQLTPLLEQENWPAVQRLLIAERGVLLNVDSQEDATWPAHQFGRRYPWTGDVYPEAAAWLAHSEAVLEKLTATTKRSRYYSPLAGRDEPPRLPAAMLPDIISMVDIAEAFSLRAMLRMGQGDLPEAWADTLAIHRLARLAAQNPCMVAQLVAYAIEDKAIDLEECVFASRAATGEQLQSMLADVRALTPLPSLAKTFDRMERCMLLECVQAAARQGGAGHVLTGNSMFDVAEPTPSAFDWWINQIVDWNNVLAEGNAYFDRAVTALDEPSYPLRKAACAELEVSMHKLIRDVHSPANFRASFVRGSAMERRLAAAYIITLMPGFTAAMVAEERIRMRQELAEGALMLALYRAERGEFPRALVALTPRDYARLPRDRFDQQPIRYRRSEVGYVLFSVGEDQQDDGGFRAGAWQLGDDRNSRSDVVFESPPLIQPE